MRHAKFRVSMSEFVYALNTREEKEKLSAILNCVHSTYTKTNNTRRRLRTNTHSLIRYCMYNSFVLNPITMLNHAE